MHGSFSSPGYYASATRVRYVAHPVRPMLVTYLLHAIGQAERLYVLQLRPWPAYIYIYIRTVAWAIARHNYAAWTSKIGGPRYKARPINRPYVQNPAAYINFTPDRL
jgi:hypothetical protein